MDDTRLHPETPTYRIDPNRDRLIALAQLPRWYEERTGRRLHRTVPYGWRQRGIKTSDGTLIRLPAIRLGGIYYTSVEAITWWTAAISVCDEGRSR